MSYHIKKRKGDAPLKLESRKCMCCRQAFPSEGIHNRLCEKCKIEDCDSDFSAFHGMSVSGYFGHFSKGPLDNPYDY